MTDLLRLLKHLRRPRLLIRAARYGTQGYSRERDLRRLVKDVSLPTPGRAIVTLMSEEGALEEKRKSGDNSYSFMRHVSVLIALMGEAKLMQAHQG